MPEDENTHIQTNEVKKEEPKSIAQNKYNSCVYPGCQVKDCHEPTHRMCTRCDVFIGNGKCRICYWD